jgi:hypothetical protein
MVTHSIIETSCYSSRLPGAISPSINLQRLLRPFVQPRWWSDYDEPILKFLADCGAAVPPRVILFNLEYQNLASPHRSTINRRITRLREQDLIKKVDDAGYYRITGRGRQLIDEDLDASEL